ncbi:MAG TPA: arylsulfatase [Acidimicrobiales bacterium]|nr:arylsulfatase [Acidimicrobiales bacterium]
MSADERGGAYPGFGGRVVREMSRSIPWWPERPAPPRDSPNVVVILVDDLGFSDLGCFGSEIPTPHIDSLATDGVQFTNFHAQPSCSPTRASLLTGLECHMAGFGFPAQFDPGFPGYAMELPDDVVTAGEIFRANGYATLMSGKWHLSREADGGASGSRHSWPIQRGFDRFYGFLDGFTDYHHPHQLITDNTTLCIDEYPGGYYLTDDLTDHAIDMVRDVHAADPSKPFFLYLAHGAPHAPLQAKPDDIVKYVDRYHVGWDEIRAERFERQRALGVVGRDTQLPARNAERGNQVAPWADLTDDERTLYARYMAVYAAMVDNLDQNIGRLLNTLDDLGVRDNTIVVLLSDNGASREGGERGTTIYLEGLHGGDTPDIAAELARLDLIGSARVHAHYPRGWAMASNTPNRLYKITTHAGGHQVPLVMSWPRGIAGRGSRTQYTHVVDILPTLIHMIGLSPLPQRNDADARPMAGSSFASVLHDPSSPWRHREQYYESLGNRGYYRDGWEIVALHNIGARFEDTVWELYHLDRDPTETTDLAAEHPALVAELAEAFDSTAWTAQVYPLVDEFLFFAGVRPPTDDALTQPLRLTPGLATVDRYRAAKMIQDRSFSIIVDLNHFASGDQGILVSHGSLGGGYELSIEGDQLVWTHNAHGTERSLRGAAIPEGTERLCAQIEAQPGHQWRIILSADDAILADNDGFPAFIGMAPLEGIDIGRSRRSPVSWHRHCQHGTYPYRGTLRTVTYTAGPLAPDALESQVNRLRSRQITFD